MTPRTGLSAARKRFGQHFLEPAWVDKVLRAIAPQPDDTFLEIGPGHGALTRPLAERTRSVIAFEIDRDLAAELRQTMPDNVTVVEGDFLSVPNDLRPVTNASRPTTNASRPTTNDQRPTTKH